MPKETIFPTNYRRELQNLAQFNYQQKLSIDKAFTSIPFKVLNSTVTSGPGASAVPTGLNFSVEPEQFYWLEAYFQVAQFVDGEVMRISFADQEQVATSDDLHMTGVAWADPANGQLLPRLVEFGQINQMAGDPRWGVSVSNGSGSEVTQINIHGMLGTQKGGTLWVGIQDSAGLAQLLPGSAVALYQVYPVTPP